MFVSFVLNKKKVRQPRNKKKSNEDRAASRFKLVSCLVELDFSVLSFGVLLFRFRVSLACCLFVFSLSISVCML